MPESYLSNDAKCPYAHALKYKDREAANNLEFVLGNCAKVS